MATNDFRVTVQGIPDLRQELLRLPVKFRKRALLNALRAGARVVRDAARLKAPELKVAVKRRTNVRRVGTLKRAISVRTSKIARRNGDVGVFVNVKPAKPSQRGAKSSSDPYYWRWQNFGWNPATGPRKGRGASAARRERRRLNKSGAPKRIAGRRFLEAGGAKLQTALEVITSQLRPIVQRILDKQASE